MKLYKGLAFFGVTALTVRGLIPVAKGSDVMLNTSQPYEEYKKNFLGKVPTEAIGEVTSRAVLEKLEDISNSTTLLSLEDTIKQAKQLKTEALNELLQLLTPPLEQYLNGRGLSADKALDEAYAYIRSSHLTTFQELLETVDLDTKLMLNQTLDKLADMKRQEPGILPAILLVGSLLVCCYCMNAENNHNDNPRNYSLFGDLSW